MYRTNYMILRKTPYQDNSLIVSGISPEYGKLDFLLKGVRGTGPKKFPSAELFRELAIEFREPRTGNSLASMRSCEPVRAFDAIANNPDSYLAACSHAAFLLKYSRPMLEMPLTYSSFQVLLSRLIVSSRTERLICLAKLVFLYEGGFLPEEEESTKRQDVRTSLIAYAMDSSQSCPEYTDRYWQKLSGWIESLLIYHSLR